MVDLYSFLVLSYDTAMISSQSLYVFLKMLLYIISVSYTQPNMRIVRRSLWPQVILTLLLSEWWDLSEILVSWIIDLSIKSVFWNHNNGNFLTFFATAATYITLVICFAWSALSDSAAVTSMIGIAPFTFWSKLCEQEKGKVLASTWEAGTSWYMCCKNSLSPKWRFGKWLCVQRALWAPLFVLWSLFYFVSLFHTI